jgi:hypothetical protein
MESRLFRAAKSRLREISFLRRMVNGRGGRRTDEDYVEMSNKCKAGSIEPDRHKERLVRKWQPRRHLSKTEEARIALVCMETWESRSLIPPILSSRESVHIPIIDTTDYDEYLKQQSFVLREFLGADRISPFDLVLVYATNAQLSSETLSRISERGPLVALMCLDDKHSFEERHPVRGWPAGQVPLIGSVHVHLTNSRECVRWYDCADACALHWPEGANPDFGYLCDVQKDIAVSFVGQKYGQRIEYVNNLRKQGINVTCFGRGWENPFVSDVEMFRVFARSKINLGFGYVGVSKEITCLKARDFDVTGSGNFYMTTYDAELAECFDVGREIACYRNEIECAELIRYYLDNDQLRYLVAEAGRKRVLREHLWQHRLDSLMRWAGMVKP